MSLDRSNSTLDSKENADLGLVNVAIEISDEETNDSDSPNENGVSSDTKPPVEDPPEKIDLNKEPTVEEPVDPWSTDIALKNPQTPWKELSTARKVKRVLWHYFLKVIILIGLLYMFICSLDFLSSAFKLLGGRTAGKAFADNELLQNPVAGLMVGVLATVLVQSSSTSTSIVVTMVAANILYVRTAIPIVMGANIGTSVTNTIVSLGHVADVEEFRRAFGGATVHDMFNWMTVLIILPIEAATGYLYQLSKAIINSMDLQTYTSGKRDLLKTITKPLTKLVIQVDSKQIAKIAKVEKGAEEKTLIKGIWCKYQTFKEMENRTMSNVTEVNGVNVTTNYTEEVEVERKVGVERCPFLFANVAGVWKDEWIGAILLVIALVILCVCLVLIVKLLNSLLRGSVAAALKRFINADFPRAGFLTGYIAILIGAGLTILVQSSSIFTSTMTPLVGIGVLSIDRMYPLTLGSNIGTTATGLLASLAATGPELKNAMQVAFCHLFFNITGILIFYPIPFMRKVPLNLAKFLGNKTAKYRWFAFVYLFVLFFIIPAAVFGLSLAGWYVVLAVLAPIVILILIILIIKLIQNKRPQCLPPKCRDFKSLPLACRSLAPLDRILRKLCVCCKFKKCQDTPQPIKTVVPKPVLYPVTNPGFEMDQPYMTIVEKSTNL